MVANSLLYFDWLNIFTALWLVEIYSSLIGWNLLLSDWLKLFTPLWLAENCVMSSLFCSLIGWIYLLHSDWSIWVVMSSLFCSLIGWNLFTALWLVEFPAKLVFINRKVSNVFITELDVKQSTWITIQMKRKSMRFCCEMRDILGSLVWLDMITGYEFHRLIGASPSTKLFRFYTVPFQVSVNSRCIFLLMTML